MSPGLREDLDAGGAGLGGGCGERVRPAGGESEVDALGGEGPENTQADACAGAGENGVPTADVDGRASRWSKLSAGSLAAIVVSGRWG